MARVVGESVERCVKMTEAARAERAREREEEAAATKAREEVAAGVKREKEERRAERWEWLGRKGGKK